MSESVKKTRIRTKEFNELYGRINIGDQINEFLDSNLVELIDVKYSTTSYGFNVDYEQVTDYSSFALLIYREEID